MISSPIKSDGKSDKTNLYDELVELLEAHGKTIDHIAWVECIEHGGENGPNRRYIPIVNFVTIAKNTYYDQSEWRIQIPTELRIYGRERSFLVEVEEYDGRQNLRYVNMEKTAPEKFRMVDSLLVKHGDCYDEPVWSKEPARSPFE